MLIGLSGYARSGKDAVARQLVESHGFCRLALGDVLKDFLLALDPLIPHAAPGGVTLYRLSSLIEHRGWELAKVRYPEVRELLQRCGTEAGQGVLGQNVWVDVLMRQVSECDGDVVVSDVRFPHEADAIRDAGGLVVRVERPDVLPPTDEYGEVHVSETALLGYEFDGVIVNGGSLADLRDAVDQTFGVAPVA